jgi:hypothetical protein
MDDLTIYQGNTGTIRATIKTGLSDTTGYTGYLIARKSVSDTINTIDLSTNNWDASTALFDFTSVDSSVDPGKYVDEFYVSSSENTFTVGMGDLYVTDTLSK